MSTIQHLFNKTITVRRTQNIGNYRRAMSTVTCDVPIHIQYQDSNTVIDINDVDAYNAEGWLDIDSDIKKDDQAIGSDGRIYRVTNTVKMGEGVAINEHLHVFLREYPK
jgi:hypothetical protein